MLMIDLVNPTTDHSGVHNEPVTKKTTRHNSDEWEM